MYMKFWGEFDIEGAYGGDDTFSFEEVTTKMC